MLDEAEIRKEIARLEYEESSYSNYAKLANLYTIRGQMRAEGQAPAARQMMAYSGDAEHVKAKPQTVGEHGDSDFLRAVSGKPEARVWPIVDELMDTLAMVNRRVYDSVMRKIAAL